jgi:hypothetical protein
MKQVVSNYSYSPATNVLTLSGVNIDQDQLLLVVAPGVGRTMYNFASGVTGVVSAGINTRVTLNASTASLTTTSPLVIYYDDQLTNNSVTISSLPAISGTVTANLVGKSLGTNQLDPILTNGAGGVIVQLIAGSQTQICDDDGNPFIASNPLPISGTVTVGNSVTVSSLPVSLSSTTIGGTARLNVTLSSATTIGATAPSYGNLYGGSDGTNLRAISVDTSGRTVVTGSVSVANTVPVSGTFWQATQPVSGTVTANVSGTVPVSGTFWQATQPVSGTVTANISGTVPVSISSVTIGNTVTVAGTVTANVASTTVTVSALPSGALTTRFGSVTTANTSQITTAVTNTSRKYLLAQNISTGTVTIGIGFSPTTTQGIQLTAGAGLTFDSFVPTGAVYWLGATTGAAYTILEG